MASARFNSCIYAGTVRHRRYVSARREFRYRLYLLYVDLAELEHLTGTGLFGWLHRLRLMRLDRRDHLGDPGEPLECSVRKLVAERLGRCPEGPVRLLTQVRHCGYVMNPISLYYCFDAGGQRLDAIVAEVTSTPWNERHCYVLDAAEMPSGRPLRTRCSKQMHVSPFLPMQMEYDWTVTRPGGRLFIHLQDYLVDDQTAGNGDKSGRLAFDATLSLRRRPLTAGSLLSCLARFPLMTVRIAAAIYLQAVRLWWRGVPFHPHPGRQRPLHVEPQSGSH